MRYKKGTRRKAIEYEKELVHYWKQHHIFEKSVEQRPVSNAYVFYDGPPFITGVPHHGTLLTSIVKDAVPRYQTMRGKRVERVWGWDCHGLPAEVFTEKKLGIHDKRDIGTKISLEDYILTCRDNMITTGSQWEDTIDRIGRWVDFNGAYTTMGKDFMESVWWAFKQLYEKGKIYESEKVLMYCTRDATPISKAEVAMDNSYETDTDPSVYVKFELEDLNAAQRKALGAGDQPVYLLAWTTTPWSLNADTALAVNENLSYALVDLDGTHIVVAESLLAKALTDEKHKPLPYSVLHTFMGKELVGLRYKPLFADRGDKAHLVWHADFVNGEAGTGIAHEAPAYGEDDYVLSKQLGFPMVLDTDEEGYYTEGPWKGQQIWEANKQIAKELNASGVVWKIEYIRHEYPHCHRCHTKLMYRAHPSWFMDINGQREQMLEQNSTVHWYPEYIKNGRSAKTIETAPDWNLSRDRFWATAMPVWKGTDNAGREHIKVVGSYEELKELSGVTLHDYHRPWVDEVTFDIDGVHYTRIDKVLDCWFESGSMPFAQFHYPFENVDKFERNFPGDFIVEYVPQVRAWFYYMNAVCVGLFGRIPFKNALVHGTLAGNDGRKMSKSFGNYTDPNELMDQYSADSLRFLLLSSPLLNGEDFALLNKDVADVSRKLAMIWNMFDFFTLYAEADNWEWNGSLDDPLTDLTNPLDIWVVSRLHQLQVDIETHMEAYNLPEALKPVLTFVDDASNWYVRRSRRRFWKSGDDTDKQAAYRTLHYLLVRLSLILAPFVPFLSEELYRQLTGGESVHLLDWPAAGQVNEIIIQQMAFIRQVVNDGLAQRAVAGIKVRQPLRALFIKGGPASLAELGEAYMEILKDELNVKAVQYDIHGTEQVVRLDTVITPELQAEGRVREAIRNVQAARKAAGLEVSDHIKLSFSTTDIELRGALHAHAELIMAEALARRVDFDRSYVHESTCTIDGLPLTIALEKL